VIWKKHKRAKLRGIVLHTQAYLRAPKSASHRISFWFTPERKEYGSIRYLLSGVYNQQPLLLCLIDWHPAMPVSDPCPLLCLAQKAKAPSPYFINTLSIYSRVLFIKNDKLPKINDVQTMSIVDDIDYAYQ
jgi:hypothetical protein